MKKGWNPGFRRMVLLCASLLALSGTAFGANQEQVYEQARGYLAAGDADAAYALLTQYEGDWSGNDAYDYLLGIAALDSGESGEAIFSLQRLVARRPSFAGARMELARAYYDIGDNELARVEFERVLADNPPEKVQLAAADYLAAIDNNARAYKSDIQYYVDLGFGYDSNPAAATDNATFLGFALASKNLEQESAVLGGVFGVQYSKPLTPDLQLLLSGRADHRSNPSAHHVDISNIDLGGGLNWALGEDSLSLVANTVFSALDGTYNKQDIGATVSYLHKFNDSMSLSGFLRGGALRFEEDALSVQDVDQLLYGLSLNQTYGSALFNVTLTGNTDDAKESTSLFSADGYGLRLSHSWFRAGGKVYFVDASASRVEYDEQFFEMDREDDSFSVGLGGTWNKFPMKDWSTTVRVNYSAKDSSVSLYEYDRLEVGFTLRKMF